MDAALAEVSGAKLVKATLLPRVGRLRSAEPIEAAVGMGVEKVGRTTSYTQGKVTDVAVDVNVSYETGVLKFADQVLVVGALGSFSAAGDSGSLIVDRATKRATALLFAGSPTHTIANHIDDVLGALAVTLVR